MAGSKRTSGGQRVFLTGASGTLGRVLVPQLADAGYRVIASDLIDFPDPLPAGASFPRADITDPPSLEAACPEDVATIIHFGGINTEKSPEAIHEINILGTFNIFELARRRSARVVYASSNHAVGFYPRSDRLVTIEDPCRPDGYYGLSKAYAELLGRLYWDKHAVESVHLRIGSCLPEPTEERHRATWLSYPDLGRLVDASIEAEHAGYAIVWGISANTIRWWGGDDAARIGYQPQDNAENYASMLKPDTGGAVALAFQGGWLCEVGYTRGG